MRALIGTPKQVEFASRLRAEALQILAAKLRGYPGWIAEISAEADRHLDAAWWIDATGRVPGTRWAGVVAEQLLCQQWPRLKLAVGLGSVLGLLDEVIQKIHEAKQRADDGHLKAAGEVLRRYAAKKRVAGTEMEGLLLDLAVTLESPQQRFSLLETT